jgi:ribosomal protein S28E/S33
LQVAGVVEIMRRTGLSKPSVRRCQERYPETGADGLLRDKTRPSPILALPSAKVAEVIGRTPGRAAARRRDPLDRTSDGAAKVADVVALYVAPSSFLRFVETQFPTCALQH